MQAWPGLNTYGICTKKYLNQRRIYIFSLVNAYSLLVRVTGCGCPHRSTKTALICFNRPDRVYTVVPKKRLSH